MSFIKKNYHWLIVALVLIQLTIHGGTINNLPLFILPVSESFGVSRSAFSVAISMKALASFLGTYFSGAVLLRYGYRKSLITFLSIGILGLGLLSVSTSVAMYAVGYILFGLADGVCISAGPPRIINAWFHRHQGTVLGLVTAATGLGGSLMCLLLSGIIEISGWNSAFVCVAVLIGVITVAMLILVRDRPKELGLKPYGEGQHDIKKKEGGDHWIGYTYQEMTRSPAFYLMIVGTFLSCIFVGGALGVVIPHLQDQGLSASQAATMQSTMMMALAGVKFGYGFLTDTIGAKKVMMIGLGATVISMVMLVFATGPVSALLTVLIFSLALPLTSVMIPLLSPAVFGYQAQTRSLGIFMAMISLAGIISSPVANMIYDAVGSYNPFFLIAAVGTVALIGLYAYMFKVAEKDKARMIAEHEEQ